MTYSYSVIIYSIYCNGAFKNDLISNATLSSSLNRGITNYSRTCCLPNIYEITKDWRSVRKIHASACQLSTPDKISQSASAKGWLRECRTSRGIFIIATTSELSIQWALVCTESRSSAFLARTSIERASNDPAANHNHFDVMNYSRD